MASAIVFNPLAYTKGMKAAGFTNEQAEALAQSRAELIEERLATKPGIVDLRRDMQQDLKELEYRIITRPGGLMVVGFWIMGVLVKILWKEGDVIFI
ncbi:MAG: DUF1640 domain-containing protein [Magnetococcales bacterium]|nr:DUF1640 domain-containing protein [Magnetococcales bacterium]MBF0150591.1 DUF1640 domain-containing protein [Magnetococcales bacterium]